jgi:hypothetical protein
MALDLIADMDSVFLNSGFEEPITYIPDDSDGLPISAIVFRDTESLVSMNNAGGNFNQSKHYDIQIYVSRSSVPIVKENADKVQLKQRPGDTSTKTFTVSKIIRMDEGAYRLGLL